MNTRNNIKINLFLSGIKGYEVLKFIINNHNYHIINFVLIGQDKNIENDFSNEIEELCINKKLKFKFRVSGKEMIPAADFSIAVAWKWLIKQKDILIVLHDSLLPKYRGYLPLVSQLINGEKEIGVTSFFANDKYDEGDIIYSSKIDIKYPITIEQAINQINICYEDCMSHIFHKLENNLKFKSTPQNHKKASYSIWRDENDYSIDWNWSVHKICRFIDSVGFPYKGAKTILNDQEVSINKAEIIPDLNIENRDCGKIFKLLNGKPIVICKDGLLLIKDAINRNSKESILPLKKVKLRFRNG